MSLLQLKNASIILGHPPLLNGIELVIHPGERLCLVGRNGCGKSTLLKVIEADIKLDDGQRLVNKEVKISLKNIVDKGLVFVLIFLLASFFARCFLIITSTAYVT
mgnify:CR=1 FL=1